MKEIEFNLLTEPWIRVRLRDNTVREVSLTEALVSAQDYADLAGEMPTQNAAVLRLLLAVLFTVFSFIQAQGDNLYETLMLNLTLLRDGREAEARALAEQADESALVAALQTLEDHARADFTAVRLSLPTRLAACPQAGERVRAVFHTQRTPVENAMTLGVVHTNTKLTFAPLIPGSLQSIGDDAYAAEFDASRLAAVIEYAGRYMLALGGRFADGQPFAGLAETEFFK